MSNKIDKQGEEKEQTKTEKQSQKTPQMKPLCQSLRTGVQLGDLHIYAVDRFPGKGEARLPSFSSKRGHMTGKHVF